METYAKEVPFSMTFTLKLEPIGRFPRPTSSIARATRLVMPVAVDPVSTKANLRRPSKEAEGEGSKIRTGMTMRQPS